MAEMDNKNRKISSNEIKFSFGKVFTNNKQIAIFLIVLIIITILPTYFLINQNHKTSEKQILGYATGHSYIWQEDDSVKVDPYFSPAVNPSKINPEIQLEAVRREYVSTQIVIRPYLENQYNFSVELNNFVKIDGDSNTDDNNNSSSNIEITTNEQELFLEEIIRGEFFDRLVPANNSFVIQGKNNHPLYYKIYVSENVPSGNYKSALILRSGNVIYNITINLKIYDITLPVNHSYKSMIKPSSKNMNFIDNYLEHRLDFDGIPMDYSWNSTTKEWSFNWTEWDNLTQYIIEHGQRSFRIGSPSKYLSYLEKYSLEYNNSVISFHQQVAQHLRDKGWLDFGYIYEIDEPSVEECIEFEPWCELVHQGDPELKILLTTAPRDEISFLYDDINIWAPIENDVPTHLEELKMLQKNGAEIVYYPCLYPKPSFANIQIYNRLIEGRTLAWQVYRWGFDGFLYWQTIAYYHNMHGYGYNSWLDGWLLYSRDTTNGIYDSSLRWEMLREGFEDIELFYLVKQNAENGYITSQDFSSFTQNIENLLPAWDDFSADPSEYTAIKNQAISLLIESN